MCSLDVLRSRAIAHLAAASFLGGCLLLREFPPSRHSFYPRCPIFLYFHLYCPGCGATRALAALTHAHFAEALHDNSFFVILLPVLIAYFAFAYWKAVRNPRFSWPVVPARALHLLLAAAFLFAMVRNAFHLSI
jgi:Protein of unknown function (DUF2752)